MGYRLWFGKYRGVSLEEVALGKKCPGGGGKSEGYYYFNQLANGDPKYFTYFQSKPTAMQKWNEIHHKLNRFIPAGEYEKCPVCKTNTATKLSIAGSGQYGYSVSPGYRCCDNDDCQKSMLSMPSSGAMIYPIAFDVILRFGWSSGNRKYDQERVAEVLKTLAGWEGKITDERATDFINSLRTR